MAVFGVAPVFHVSDLAASLRHYTEVLGFEEKFQYGGFYAGLQRGEAQLHLSVSTPSRHPVGGASAYFFCDDVDTYHAEVKAKGATISTELKDYDYGMRDFEIEDPDGNTLTFGQEK
jgi:catechol 2,3-dioxygenase-like lactoylglutathione lyase family enzyme